VFKEGQYVDVIAVTKGKGFQGVIKRFHVHRRQHKSEKGVRKVGAIGSRGPGRIFPTNARPNGIP